MTPVIALQWCGVAAVGGFALCVLAMGIVAMGIAFLWLRDAL